MKILYITNFDSRQMCASLTIIIISADINLINANIFFINNFNMNLTIYLYLVIIYIKKMYLYCIMKILEVYHILIVKRQSK